MVYEIEFHTRPNGDEPAKEFINLLWSYNPGLASYITATIQKLAETGHSTLLQTKMLQAIRGEPHMYEIKKSGGRIGIYHDVDRRRYIILDGFTKKRQIDRRAINRWRTLVNEYIEKTEEG